MRIILEGPDNTGKSTLAKSLAEAFGLPIYIGRGPVTSDLDFMSRWLEYSFREVGVFDRHFCISEPLYSRFFSRGGKFHLDELVEEFYSERPLIIYCQSASRLLDGHTATSPTDTPEYLSKLSELHNDICSAYDEWADDHADLRYKIGDHIPSLVVHVKEKLDARNKRLARFPQEVRARV